MSHPPPLVVPLGCNCFPRWSATILGYKKTRREGELSYPLDLGVWPMPMVREMIATDFAGMAEPENLLVRHLPSGEPILCDRRFPSSSYNHEMPPISSADFVADNFRLFTERYRRRIDNFRHSLATSPRVVLFMTATNLLGPDYNPFSYDDFAAIHQTLSQRYPQTSFRLLVVIERFQQTIPDSWDGRIRVFNFQIAGPYTLYMPALMTTMFLGNVLGSVVNSFD